jgi:hypothetical protein
MVLTEITNSEISGNTISTTGGGSRGIELRGHSNSNQITANMVHTTGSGSQGIRIGASSNLNTITNNTFQADNSYTVSIASGSDNELIGNTLISPNGYLKLGRESLQNGGMGVDSAGNIYAVENNWGSSAGSNSGVGVATAFFQVDPGTGLANSVIPLLENGVDVGFGFDALDILPDGRIMALAGGGISSLYEIDPTSGEVTEITLNLPVLQGGLNGLEAASNTVLFATTNQGALAKIDLTTPTTGVVTVIRESSIHELTGRAIGLTGLALHPTSGKGYAVSRSRDEDSGTSHLYEIWNGSALVFEEIGDTGIGTISDIDFDQFGTLYGNNGRLVEISTDTGLGTIVGDWFGDDPLEPLPQNNTIENNVMQTAQGSINFTGSIILPSEVGIDIPSWGVRISSNEAMVDSTALPFLDEPATITLENLTGTSRDLLVDPEDDGSFVPCDSPQCTPVSFTGGTLVFNVDGFTTYSSIEPEIEPVLDIKANGSDGPLVIGVGTPLQLDISLDSNDAAGQAADWWLVRKSPGEKWFWYVHASRSWVESPLGSPIPAHQGNLFDFGPFTAFNASNLPIGSYSVYFAVDTKANGVLDMDALLFDKVDVNIQ